MKNYYSEDTILIVGTADEVKAVEKSLRRAVRKTDMGWRHGIREAYRTNLAPWFVEPPKFRAEQNYGLLIDEQGYWRVLSANAVLEELGMA